VAELERAFGKDVACNLIEGSGGIFDVVVDGKKLFSKHDTGRFPDDGEIPALIKSKTRGK
jgi:selenoprotein W-related protein